MRRVVGPVVLLLAGGLLVACSASSDSTGDQGGDTRAGSVTEVGDQAGADLDAAVDTAPAVDRQVVTSGSVEIVVSDPGGAAQRASEAVEAAGGRVEERVEEAGSDEQRPSAHLVVRIPAAALTATLDRLKALGDVERVQLTATDVTDQAQDLDARISALTVSVGRLQTLMGTATSSDDLLALESALSSRQADLESMQSQRAGLAGRVALATITLELRAEPTVEAGGPDGFWSGLGAGWGALLTTLGAVLIAVGVVLPWLAFFGVLGLLALAATRLVRARRAVPVPVAAAAPAGDDLDEG